MHSISSSPTAAGSDSQILEILSMLSIDRLISHRRTEFCTARSGMIRTPNRVARAVRGPRLRLDMLLQLACSNNRVILEAVGPYGTARPSTLVFSVQLGCIRYLRVQPQQNRIPRSLKSFRFFHRSTDLSSPHRVLNCSVQHDSTKLQQQRHRKGSTRSALAPLSVQHRGRDHLGDDHLIMTIRVRPG